MSITSGVFVPPKHLPAESLLELFLDRGYKIIRVSSVEGNDLNDDIGLDKLFAKRNATKST